MQTKYDILISRKQFVQQQIKYIAESIHFNSLQKKYFLQANPFGGYFSAALFFNWQYNVNIAVSHGDTLPSFISDL